MENFASIKGTQKCLENISDIKVVFFNGMSIYEEDIRVPLIVKGPGVKKNYTVQINAQSIILRTNTTQQQQQLQ